MNAKAGTDGQIKAVEDYDAPLKDMETGDDGDDDDEAETA